jgi:hypothetical protein
MVELHRIAPVAAAMAEAAWLRGDRKDAKPSNRTESPSSATPMGRRLWRAGGNGAVSKRCT